MVDAGIDADRLGQWLDRHHAPGHGELPELEKLGGGSQNVLLRVKRGDTRMVLRMPGARADERRLSELLQEIRLIRALRGTDVPHAELIAADETGELLGKPFYVMAEINGWSPMDGGWQPPFDTDLEARRGLAFQLVEGAAKLGRVDWRARGLEGFGHPEGFHERQVDRWLSFLKGFQVRELPGLDEAAAWLRANRPDHFTPGIMHGDYQFANVMYRHGAPAQLAAIVDWEMGTVGDPKLDLAWVVQAWPDDTSTGVDMGYVDLEGMPNRAELLEHYATASGRQVDDIDYYCVLAKWKLAVILEQGYQRAGDDPKLAAFGPIILDLMQQAADLAESSEYQG